MQNILEILGFCHTGILSGWVCVFLHFVLNWDSVSWDSVSIFFFIFLNWDSVSWDFVPLGFCLSEIFILAGFLSDWVFV